MPKDLSGAEASGNAKSTVFLKFDSWLFHWFDCLASAELQARSLKSLFSAVSFGWYLQSYVLRYRHVLHGYLEKCRFVCRH